MSTYIYKARSIQGGIEKGSLEALDQGKAVSLLQEKGLVILSIKETEDLFKTRKSTKKRHFRIRVKTEDLASLSRQLATLLDAGVPLLRCLDIVREQVEAKPLYSALGKVTKDVEGGDALSVAMAKHPKVFSEFWTNLIATGETSGQLPFVLIQLTKYMESTASLQRKVLSALIYPIILSFAATGALIVFIVVVIPMFAQLYSYFGASLPVLTQVIISLSAIFKRWLPVMVIFIAIFAVLLVKFRTTEKGKRFFDKLKIKVPVINALFYNVILYRFSSGLSMLLKSGVPILYALEVVAKAVANNLYENIIVQAKDKVREGDALGTTLNVFSEEFPPFVTNMIKVGEESGNLPVMLGHLADYYQEKVETVIARLPYIIEPAIILIIGGVIGIIVLGMFLPIFGLATAVNM
ncbi:MAG: type II secretion system F family protein [Candidatus Saelkia tenebricola]|nr:type II secretion system F family protein [Candidatus Saelkia tenebricola]